MAQTYNLVESKATDLFGVDCVRGKIKGLKVVHKFGRNRVVPSGVFTPITIGGIYRTPQPSAATTLRIKAGGNANDTLLGTGARKVTLTGVDSTCMEIMEEVELAGISASASTTAQFLRLYEAIVTESGTYATQAIGSHAGDIVIEDTAGTEDWATIDSTLFPKSQTEIGNYTVPAGKTAYILSILVSVDSNKAADVALFQRQGVGKTAAPFDAMRLVIEFGALLGVANILPKCPLGPFPALTDLGFMAQVVAGTADVDVDFEILVIDDVNT